MWRHSPSSSGIVAASLIILLAVFHAIGTYQGLRQDYYTFYPEKFYQLA